MSNQVQIEVFQNGARLGTIDIEDSRTFPLALTYTLTDIREPEKRKGSFSKKFKVPATSNNNSVLKHIYYITVEKDDALNGLDCQITLNGLPIAVGLIRAEKSKSRLDPTEYELNFLGSENSWAQQLKEKNIRDYTYNSPSESGNQKLNNPNIKSSWDGSYPDWDFVYPLINYGTWTGWNSNNDEFFAAVENMRPWVYVKSILEQAFTDIGYTIKSDFLDSDEFKGLILNCNRFILKPELLEGSNAVCDNNFDIEYQAGAELPVEFNDFVDPNGLFTQEVITADVPVFGLITVPATVYNAPGAGTYKVTVQGQVSSGTINVYTNNSGTGIYELSQEVLVQSSLAINNQVDTAVTFPIIENGGAIITFKTTGGTLFANTKFIFEQTNEIKKNTFYDVAYTLPDLTPLEVLQGLNKMFNLYYRTVIGSRTVYIEPRDDFYLSKSNALDWSSKLDVPSVEIEFPNSAKRELIFNYKEDNNDGFLKERNEREEEVLGEQKIFLPLKFPKGEKKLQSDYAYTTFIKDKRVSANTANPVEIPRLWAEYEAYPEFKDEFEPRVMYYKGNVNQNSPWKFEKDVITPTDLYEVINTVPFATMNDADFNLNFNGDTGLVNTYWRNEIGTIVKGRILVCEMYLNPTDLQNLNLRVPIYIDKPELKGYFYIQSIKDYQPTKTQLTEVELIPVVEFYSLENLEAIVTQEINEKIRARLAGNTDTGVWIENLGFSDSYAEAKGAAFGNGLYANAGQTVVGSFNNGLTSNVFEIGVGNEEFRVNGLALEVNNPDDPREGVQLVVNGGVIYTTTGERILYRKEINGDGNTTAFGEVTKLG